MISAPPTTDHGRDAFIAAAVNYFASFIAGLVVFALLGYMATIMDVNINDVATEGKSLSHMIRADWYQFFGHRTIAD